MSNSFEAAASVTVTIKSPAGFEELLTIRDYEDKELTKKQLAYILNLDKTLIELGFTPVVRGGFKKESKPLEYVPDRTCPNDGAKLIYAFMKDGKRFIKCENNKYVNGQQSGCKFVEWPK